MLRLLGPVLEIACLFALFGAKSGAPRVFGRSLGPILWAGVGVGLVMVFAGIVLTAGRRR